MQWDPGPVRYTLPESLALCSEPALGQVVTTIVSKAAWPASDMSVWPAFTEEHEVNSAKIKARAAVEAATGGPRPRPHAAAALAPCRSCRTSPAARRRWQVARAALSSICQATTC